MSESRGQLLLPPDPSRYAAHGRERSAKGNGMSPHLNPFRKGIALRKLGATCALLALSISAASPRLQDSAPQELSAEQLWKMMDRDGDGLIQRYEGMDAFLWLSEQADANGDGQLQKQEWNALAELEFEGPAFDDQEEKARFEVRADQAHMNGVIGPSTPGRLLELIFEHPEVRTIVMHDAPGSMDDEANLRAARYLQRYGLHTHLPEDAVIASGGVDLFLAGVQRSAEAGARLGVHSWGGGPVAAVDIPEDSAEHEFYLKFYRDIGIDEDFYWYTLESAPARGIHWMTHAEIEHFSVLTGEVPGNLGSDRQAIPEPEAEFKEEVFQFELDTSAAPNGILHLPPSAPRVLRQSFDRYTRILAPNGKPIHFFAQDKVSDEMLVRAREVMRFYLSNAPGTRFGADKSAVANSMGDLAATLVYFNTEADSERAIRGELGELNFFAQDLYAEESVVEGSAAYLDNSVRDATMEEVFHLVQGAGIQAGLGAYQARIEAAAQNAVEKEHWFTNPEWEAEGSSSFEYIISVIDVLYGFWAHDPQGTGESFHGEYRYSSAQQVRSQDPMGAEVLMEFLPPLFSFEASVAASFEGEFCLSLDPDKPYTFKSQYLTNVRLTGSHPSALSGNAHDNRLVGNSAPNLLRGAAGDDLLDGGPGHDVALMSGKRSDYLITKAAEGLWIQDKVADRDGRDSLLNIEALRFLDGELSGAQLASH